MNGMQYNAKIYRLRGVVQHYSWGGKTFLPTLLRLPNADSKPFAEYWMGAHGNGPAVVINEDGSAVKLDQLIQENPTALLGESVEKKFGRLPYLLKILDVKDMLSIQVHPTSEAAEREFAAEHERGVPLNAPNRNYKDTNHKPELMLALGDFWLLHGFKSAPLLRKKLEEIHELQFLLPHFAQNDYKTLYGHIMQMDEAEVNERLSPLIRRIVPQYEFGTLTKTDEDFWAARAYRTFCSPGHIDRGIFSIYLLNLTHMRKGDAIFQDAGVLHAYLEGHNVEIMANSDNVLRGGLTNKHVDVAELMKHVDFRPVHPEIIHAVPVPGSPEKTFPTAAADFELHELDMAPNADVSVTSNTADVFFVYEGEATASDGKNLMEVFKGDAILAAAGTVLHWKATLACTIFHATVPASKGK